ncbi:MAG: CBS domain-containing protein [Betaproteobacteria bacterium]|nr:CBS domain-containing protein [Betaproteobacteria bacterium]
MRDYRVITAAALEGPVTVCRPPTPKPVTLGSDALDVMTDLNRVYAAVIEPQMNVDAARTYMIQRGVRLLFVLNADKTLAGLVTANDILGEKPMRIVQERGIHHDEILIADIQTPLAKLDALPMSELAHAKVGHVLATLQDTGRQHALAVDDAAEGKRVCGIFSLSQIARQLGVSVQTTEVAKSFAEIEAVLAAESSVG